MLMQAKALGCLLRQFSFPGRLQVQSTAVLCFSKLRSIWNWVSEISIQLFKYHTEARGQGGGEEERRNANNQKRISLLYPSQEIKKAVAPAAPSRLLLIKQDIPFTPNSDELWLIWQHLRPCVKYCPIKAQHPFTQQRVYPSRHRASI